MTKYYVYIIKCEKWKSDSFQKYLFYTGMTSNPKKRLQEHKSGIKSNWMNNNNIRPLHFSYIEDTGIDYWRCIEREKQVKRMSVIQKNKLIEEYNNK